MNFNIGNVGAKYLKALRNKAKYIVSVGGTRSGKTYEALQLLNLIALKATKPLVIIIAGLTVPITKKNLIRPFKNIAGPKIFDKFNKQEATLEYPNGTVLYFMSTGESRAEEKFTGIEADYVLLDEINLSPEAEGVVRQLGMRLKKGAIIMSLNPTRRLQWLVDIENNPKSISLHSTYKDNLNNLPKSLVEEIEYRGSIDERFKAVYLEGRYMADTELAIFNNFKVVNTVMNNYDWIRFGQDYGFKNDATTLIETRYNKDTNTLWIRGRGYATGMSTNEIKEMNKQAGNNLIIADSAEPRLISELSATCKITPIKKYPNHKIEAIRQLQNVNIEVYYDDKDLVREIEDYQYKKVAGVVVDEPRDKDDHYLDALIYATRDSLEKAAGKYSYM